MIQLDEILARLGLDKSNGLFLMKDADWKTTTAFPNRVKRLLEHKIKPDAFFCFDNKPLILFFYNPFNKKELHKAIWNFNECPIAIIIENDAIEILNGFNYLKEKETLEKLGDNKNLSNFTYFEIVTGRTWEQYKEHLNYKNRVDYHLLNNIKAARKLLVEQHQLDAKITNAVIGKCIFVRYLIDRKVKMKFDGKLRPWTTVEFCDLLNYPVKSQQFFNYLEDNEKGFNGDLFPLIANEYKKITKEDYQVLRRLLQGEDISINQPSLFELYDFSIIPIEFISNVYELFIGQDNQKNEGAYYTPLFLVDYILKETVEKHLTEADSRDKRINKVLSNDNTVYSYCKVLDPACGSGIFLVETLRKIIEKYISDTNVDVKSSSFKTAIKNLALENIYGIDKDLSAVQVAVFSIYLTLLDYLEPPGIETFKFPHLLNTNFFEADFFDADLSFNNILNKNIDFDFILGNPPWMRGKGEKQKPLYIKYVDQRRKREKNSNAIKIEIGNREIAQAFLLRSSDFSSEKTKCAIIVTSKVLYNLQSASFRKYFLHNFFIQKVFELSPVRREVFDKSNDKAIAPACILFFNYANGINTDKNTIEHISLKPSRFFSLFKIFTINRTDFKRIQQDKLKENDWLWKVLVYGSFLDFNFIKRLYSETKVIDNIINAQKILFKQGLKRKDGNKKIQVKELIGKPFLNTQNSELKPFQIINTSNKWEQESVGYVYQENNKPFLKLFKPYSLLIAGGISNDFTSKAAINHEERVFTSSIRALKVFDANQLPVLYSINSILCSSLFAYYMLTVGASAGIEREESEDEEIKKMWYATSEKLVKAAINIETVKKEENEIILKSSEKSVKHSIDPFVYKAFSLSSQEEDLISYATNVSIPIIMRHEGYESLFKGLPFEDNTLKSYANLFIKRFKPRLETNDKKFIVEIWYTNQVVGMLFKLVPVSKYKENVIWIQKQNDSEIISLLTKISTEKITDKLFVQKDIRGFEKDYFYLFKPNEKRLWDKAIGYLDVNEFAEAILKSGRGENNVH